MKTPGHPSVPPQPLPQDGAVDQNVGQVADATDLVANLSGLPESHARARISRLQLIGLCSGLRHYWLIDPLGDFSLEQRCVCGAERFSDLRIFSASIQHGSMQPGVTRALRDDITIRFE